MFCDKIQCSPVPVSSVNLCRYVAFLGRTRCFSTVQQYVNIIRILHLELGYSNPLKDNFPVKLVLSGLKRGKGQSQSFKLPINPHDLIKFRGLLNMDSLADCRFWAAAILCFYGLFRISNVTVISGTKVAQSHSVRRKDVDVVGRGCVITVMGTKTIQFRERSFQVPLPYIKNHPLCPTSALLRFMAASGDLPGDLPLFTSCSNAGLSYLTQAYMRRRLTQCLGAIGLPATLYGTHSLRRGGATWMLLTGVPLEVIKAIGDWRSDCVTKYLTPDICSKFRLVSTACGLLPNV